MPRLIHLENRDWTVDRPSMFVFRTLTMCLSRNQKVQKEDDIDDSVYLLMADIFVTGYFGVKRLSTFSKIQPARGYKAQEVKDISILQIGAGPVGLCALHLLKHFGFEKIVVVDSIPSRLEAAKKLELIRQLIFKKKRMGWQTLSPMI